MRHPVRSCLLGLAAAGLVSGCALMDPRDSYSYGRLADGLWDADYDLLLDWNFPTSANQGPVEAPRRFRPERPAIGVPWATGNPFAPSPVFGQDKAAAAGDAAAGADAAATRRTAAAASPQRAAPVAGSRDVLVRADERGMVR